MCLVARPQVQDFVELTPTFPYATLFSLNNDNSTPSASHQTPQKALGPARNVPKHQPSQIGRLHRWLKGSADPTISWFPYCIGR